MKKRLILLTACAMAALPGLPALAQEKGAKKERSDKLTADDIKLAEKNTALPVPGEILTVLGKAGDDRWKETAATLRKAAAPATENEAARAARIGVCVADAFLAIQARDKDLLSKTSTEILELAKKLGASAPLLEKGKQIVDLAASDKWPLVLPLLDEVHLETLKVLTELGDEDSVTLALAAGWVRGTELFATALGSSYDETASKALRQGGLVDYLLSRMAKLSDSTKAKPEAKALTEALTKLKPLVSVDQKSTVSKDAVAQIAQAAQAGLAAK